MVYIGLRGTLALLCLVVQRCDAVIAIIAFGCRYVTADDDLFPQVPLLFTAAIP